MANVLAVASQADLTKAAVSVQVPNKAPDEGNNIISSELRQSEHLFEGSEANVYSLALNPNTLHLELD